MFTDSQEIQEIRVTSVTALSYLVAKESPPSFPSWRLPGDRGLRSVLEKEVVLQPGSVLGRAHAWQRFAGI